MKEYARQRIAKGVTYLTISKILLKVFSLFGFFIVVANLSLKDYGLLNILFSVLGPAVVISMLGLESVIQADVATLRGVGKFALARKTILDYSKTSLALLFFLFVAAWFLRGYIDQFYEADLTVYFWALVVLVIGQAGMNFSSLTFEAYEKFNYSALLQFLEGFIRFFFLLALYAIGFSLSSVLWAYVLSKVVAALLLVPSLVKTITPPAREVVSPDHTTLKIIRRHGKWEMFKTVTNVVTDNIWPWLVNVFVSTEAVALFAFSQKIYSTVTTVFPIKKVIFPAISSTIAHSRETSHLIIAKAQKVLLALSLPVGLGLLFLSYPIVQIWFPEYLPAVIFIQLSSLHLLVEVFSLGQTEVFYALKEQRWAFMVSMTVIFVRIISQIALIYFLGIIGVVVSWLLVSFLSAFLRELVLVYKLKFPLWNWRAFFTYDEYDRIILQMVRQKISRFIPKS